ncbi:pheromone-processing carboxypeptidase KEX1-like [Musa acuminata AAA Group]|uniref:pheromone-processing carboxypeptidase KEX1-like n=1 Tax=Musa acuminata AAA Group TaxID=214697 RepID=UPI0031E05917
MDSKNSASSSSSKPHSPSRPCLCSPTTHPGSFRCKLHRGPRKSSGRSVAHAGSPETKGPAKATSMGGLLMQMIRPSSHDLRRRRHFQPKPSRFFLMKEMEALCRSKSNGPADLHSMAELLVAETVLAVERSLLWLFLVVGSSSSQIGPVNDESEVIYQTLQRSKPEAMLENKDDGESDEDEDEDDNGADGAGQEDGGEDDLSGEEGNDNQGDDNDDDDPEVNGEGGSEDEEDDDDDDEEEEEDEEEDEDEEDEEEEEELPQPPTKKRK